MITMFFEVGLEDVSDFIEKSTHVDHLGAFSAYHCTSELSGDFTLFVGCDGRAFTTVLLNK